MSTTRAHWGRNEIRRRIKPAAQVDRVIDRPGISLAGKSSLDHYSAAFLDPLIAAVASATILAYSLHTLLAPNLPKNHAMIATIPFVLYGICQYLYLVHRKDRGGAPEQVLLDDLPLLSCIILWALTAAAILYTG